MNSSQNFYTKSIFTDNLKIIITQALSSKILLAYLSLGLVCAVIVEGLKGAIASIVNLILIAIFASIIKIMTPENNLYTPIIQNHKRIKFETSIGIVLLIIYTTVLAISYNILKIPVLTDIYFSFYKIMTNFVVILDKTLPNLIAIEIGNVFKNTILFTVPTILLFGFLGYNFKCMSIKFSYLKLTTILLLLTILIGLPFGKIFDKPLHLLFVLFIFKIFSNALPEELLFRAFLMPRIEFITQNKILTLIIISILYNILLIPASIGIEHYNILLSLVRIFSISYPTSLIWGYLFLRTRSIVPGTIIHAANGLLGYFLLS